MECTVYLTDNCNMRCSYCYEGRNKTNSNMSEKILRASIEYMVNCNPTGDTIQLLFLGGEPLLNKKMLYKALDIINSDYSQYKHLFLYQITTNGTLVEEKDICLFKDNNFEVSISIDGDHKTHDINRKSISREDVYDNIIENMKQMIEKKINLTVRMTVTTNNVKYLYKNIKYFYEMGVKHINLGLDQLAYWSEKELKVFDEQLFLLEQLYLDYIVQDENKILNIFDYKLASIVFEKKQQYCSAGTKEHFIINSKGEIYPCGYVANQEEWCLGNVEIGINTKSFLTKVKNNIQKEASCDQCEIATSCCGAKCGFMNYRLTGYLNVNSSITCKLQRIVYRHLVQVADTLYKEKNIRIMHMIEAAMNNDLELKNTIKSIINKYKEI